MDKEVPEEAFYEEMLPREAEDNYPLEEDTGLAEPCMLSAAISLEDQLSNIGVSFHDKLFELIDEAHIDNKVQMILLWWCNPEIIYVFDYVTKSKKVRRYYIITIGNLIFFYVVSGLGYFVVCLFSM